MGQPRIIYADDDFDDQTIFQQAFAELGHSDVIAVLNDGISVINYLVKTDPRLITLIILDLNMPLLNGAETLAILKNDFRHMHIPVVIFSTSTAEKDEKICLDFGACEFISKPALYSDYLKICKKFYDVSQRIVVTS